MSVEGTSIGDSGGLETAPRAPQPPIQASGPALGLAGFALCTFVLSVFNAHLVNTAGLPVLFGALLFFGGIAQFLAGMWEFRVGNTFTATIFASYGAFWMSLWAIQVFYAKLVPASVLGHALGLYLFAWAGFTFMLFVAALKTNAAVALTVLLLVATEVVLALGYDGNSLSTLKVGGYVGIATAAAAWYVMWGIVLEFTWGREVLPVFPLVHE
jgi:succinate-acetate transporter protein